MRAHAHLSNEARTALAVDVHHLPNAHKVDGDLLWRRTVRPHERHSAVPAMDPGPQMKRHRREIQRLAGWGEGGRCRRRSDTHQGGIMIPDWEHGMEG